MTPDTYKPVTLNHQAALADAMQRPGFKPAWDALEEEYSTLHALLNARKTAGLTQDELAQRMDTTKSAVSRLEASLRDDLLSAIDARFAASLRQRLHA